MDAAMRWARLLAVPATVLAALVGAPAASADLNSLLASGSCTARDAKDGETAVDAPLRYTFCDDGVPSLAGGTTPNITAERAVTVPSAYQGIRGLPATDAAAVVPGEVADNVALDVDVTLPDPTRFPAADGKFPLVVMMHGCCSGSKTSWEGTTIDPGGAENWHYNNAWFASRGYVVLNYTARGFVDGEGRGSTGETQLDSARFEINDYQHLAGQLVDRGDLDPGPGFVGVDPRRIVPTGGSYGGAFTWLALTDPTWKSPAGRDLEIVAAAAKYGWTNLVEALVPRGDDLRDSLPETDAAKVKASLAQRVGNPKRSINAALYASGKTGIPPGSPHTTFAPDIDAAQACLTTSISFESDPACASTISTTLPRSIDERSAYFQQPFFDGLAKPPADPGHIDPVPVFSAGTFTDKLFPAAEHRRMVRRLEAASPGYPVQEHYGDYNHFVQNKRKEWADVCGADRHVCRYDDYPVGDLSSSPLGLARENGVTTRLNRFIDHYAQPPANTTEPRPQFDVTGALQVCPQNAGLLSSALDEPGPRFTAESFDALAQNSLDIGVTGAQTTTNIAGGANSHARNADPVTNFVDNGGRCVVESSPGGAASAGAGVATYDSEALPSDFTMLGMTRVFAAHTGTGSALQLNARLYDLHPDGTQVLVDRGVKSLADANGVSAMDLHGAGWRFAQGHRIRIELAQDDDTYIKASAQTGSLVIQGVGLSIPVREASLSLGGIVPGSPPRIDVRSPRLASDQGTGRRFAITIRARPGTARASIRDYRLQIRDADSQGASASRRVRASRAGQTTFRFKGRPGHTYVIRAQAIDNEGRVGPLDITRTIVPFDDRRMATRDVGRGGKARRPRVRGAYGGRLTRSSRPGALMGFRFRGDRLFIVGRVSRRGGKAIVLVNRRRRVISFYAKRTRNRRVVASFKAKRSGVNTARIVTLGRRGARRARGTRVEIDALGVRTR